MTIDEMILSNQDMIRVIMLKNRYQNLPYADEIRDEAQLALVKAANTFKPNGRLTFEAWAYRKINWAMKDYMRKVDDMTRGQRDHLKQTGQLRMAGKYKSKVRAYSKKLYSSLDTSSFKRGILAESGIMF